MVIAHHLVWTVYGAWLPNDPRGSMSRGIASDVLKELGELHYGRKRVQPASRVIRTFYEDARERLKYPLLTIEHQHLSTVACGFANQIAQSAYTCYACAIMSDHVHLLIRKHRDSAEIMIANLQRASHIALRERGIRDLVHPVWGGPGWKVFLDSPDDIRRTIHYIEQNPVKIGLPVQRWDFVKKYDGWPLHPGHSRTPRMRDE
jgi:REP element-mobilizing transposase RayT